MWRDAVVATAKPPKKVPLEELVKAVATLKRVQQIHTLSANLKELSVPRRCLLFLAPSAHHELPRFRLAP